MKYSNLRAFEKHVEGTVVWHSAKCLCYPPKEEDFAEKAFTASSTKAEIKVFESEQANIDDILMELNAFSLFAEKRVVLINNADKFPKSSCEKLEAYFAAPNRSVCLILSASSLSASTNFYKKIEKAGVILDLIEEKPWEKEKSLSEWGASKISSRREKTIHPQALQHLVKQVGSDQGLLQNELEKLISYVGDRKEITPQDVGAICTGVNDENIWQLGEAIFRLDAAAALRISKALLDDGVPFMTLLRQIRSQFQTDFQVCTILSSGGSKADVAGQFPDNVGKS